LKTSILYSDNDSLSDKNGMEFKLMNSQVLIQLKFISQIGNVVGKFTFKDSYQDKLLNELKKFNIKYSLDTFRNSISLILNFVSILKGRLYIASEIGLIEIVIKNSFDWN
jgi:hypothetical protein